MPVEKRQGKGRLLRAAAAWAAAFVTAWMLACGAPVPAEAGDLRVVRGIVRTVSGSHLFLNGRSVDLSGVRIENASGKEVSISEITPGSKVGLFYRRGTLTSVLVYGPMVE